MRIFRPPFFTRWFFHGACFRIRGRGRSIFLTFDDGPDTNITPRISQILNRYGVKALFFCNGAKAEKHPEIVTSLKNEGHLIGNHGYEHYDGFRMKPEKYLRNANLADSFTSDSFFRPPYGRMTFSQFRRLRRKYLIFLWDVMPYDFDPNLTPVKCLDILKKKIRPGSVIVLHDTSVSSAPLILEEFITYSISQGYSFLLPV